MPEAHCDGAKSSSSPSVTIALDAPHPQAGDAAPPPSIRSCCTIRVACCRGRRKPRGSPPTASSSSGMSPQSGHERSPPPRSARQLSAVCVAEASTGARARHRDEPHARSAPHHGRRRCTAASHHTLTEAPPRRAHASARVRQSPGDALRRIHPLTAGRAAGDVADD